MTYRWTDQLAHPVRDTVDGATLRTRDDARSYIVELPAHRASRAQWRAAMRALSQGADTEAVTKAIELALLYEARLDMSQPRGLP